ncbi:MAG: trypsin-like peptidase domain-containing protein [Bdellovibrionaceae bacterium]|nr:trypsin-like peptidase domain-containing protein [Pseudobdellovibrionaceae bacterium]
MKFLGKVSAVLAVLAVFTACNKNGDTDSLIKTSGENDKVNPKVIYGTDDRLDLFDVAELTWQSKSNSTVALIQASKVKASGSGFSITTSNYGSSQSLCKTEPFYEQVTAAFCSGSLIGPDLIMTAGHCVRTLSSCQSTKYVFNFAYKIKGVDPKTVSADDVYSCKELVHSELNSSTLNDFAIIRLDRKVVGRSPLPIRQSGQVSVGDKLVVIGHPSGLATKGAGGATVRDVSPAPYFITNLDTYGGNSGSAVFNADTGIVEGILVRGEQDFKYQNGCYVSNVCSATGCRGEDVTRVTQILQHVDVSELAPVPVNPPPAEEDVSAEIVSRDLNVAIPDSSTEGMSSDLAGFRYNSQKLEVYLRIEHTWIGDLAVTVQAPDGEVRVLHDRIGGSKDDLEGWFKWSELKVLSREAGDGAFHIRVQDLASRDVGQLIQWGIRQ